MIEPHFMSLTPQSSTLFTFKKKKKMGREDATSKINKAKNMKSPVSIKHITQHGSKKEKKKTQVIYLYET